MSQNRRERLREELIADIKRVAREQMAVEGTATLSLRAIATELGMTSAALYRYFANRNDLITTLTVEAYQSLADTLHQARVGCEPTAYAQQALSVGLAYRAWALAHPTDYMLILGNPIPGYQQPQAIVYPVVRQAMMVFVEILEQANPVAATEYQHLPPDLAAQFADWGGRLGYDGAAFYRGMSFWTRAHGLVMAEVCGYLMPILGDVQRMYEHEIRSLLERFGFTFSV